MEETGEPLPGEGHLRVTVAAAAVNPVDLATRSGLMSGGTPLPEPLVLGMDVAGTIDALGPGVTGWEPGDAVIALAAHGGDYAGKVVLDAGLAVPAPASVTLPEASTLPLAGTTAAQALSLLGLSPGDRVLVTGAVGAVGGFAVQLAKAQGATVVAYTGEGDADLARELGADEVLVRGGDVPPRSVDAMLDAGGAPEVISAVRDGGKFVTVAARPPVSERGILPALHLVSPDPAVLRGLARAVDDGVIRLRVAERFGFEDAARAHHALSAGGTRGKILLVP